MRRLIAIGLSLLMSSCLEAAVAYSTHASVTPGTGTTATTGSFTVSGTNPVLVIHVGLDSLTATVSSVSWSLGSGTAVDVKSVRNVSAFADSWCIPAPAGGSGTATVNISASVAYQVDVSLFTGADQTTPCPTGDAVTATVTGTGSNGPITPTNLTANDANSTGDAHTVASDCGGITPNAVYTNSSTSVNLQTGYALGNTSTTATYVSESGTPLKAMVGVRVASAAAAATATSETMPLLGI